MPKLERQVSVSEIDSIDNLLVNEAWMRFAFYRFFASLHLYPDRDRLASLQNAALQLQGDGSLSLSTQFSALNEFIGGLHAGSIDQVEEEYVGLFTVNPFAPPYESYYQDPEGFVRSWVIIQLENEYAGAGLNISRTFKEPADHVAIELEFMAFLCSQEAKGREIGNENNIRSSLDRQNRFLGSHLGKWYSRFAHAVNEAPTDGLYNHTVEATNAFLSSEKSRVRAVTD
jgi:TorA maturation chaperone TorD